jgi:hypothetical protein
MGWDNERMQKLEYTIEQTMLGKRPINVVPFYLYTYPPEDELSALREFKLMELRLKGKKFTVETLSMTSIFFTELEKWLGSDDPQELIEGEKDRIAFQEDISREMIDHICNALVTIHQQKDRSNCTIITRTGCLFPFIHISNLLSKLEGKIQTTLVILYPGKEGYMLDYPTPSPNTYYRGEFF